jgi:multimeric flavodoxin WrbA
MVEADALVIGSPLYFRGPPAKMQAFIERLISLSFFLESRDESAVSPVAGKLCGLVGTAEYSNPHQILEYLVDFCTVLKMRPVLLDKFPYLGVAAQGDADGDEVFSPYLRSKDLARSLLTAIHQ